MGESENAVSFWESGWNRLKKFYDFENTEYDMERDVVLRTSRMAFLCGFFVGGISTSRESFERFERHSTGKKFLSKRDAFVSLSRMIYKFYHLCRDEWVTTV